MQISGLFVGAVFGVLFAKATNAGEWANATLLGLAFLHQLWLWQADWRKTRGQTS